jgi:hypothetical protein
MRAKIAAVTLGLVGPMLLAGPADGATKTRSDPEGDAPARVDVTEARYRYGDDRTAVVITVPELGDVGRVYLRISRYEIFEAGYVLRLRKKAGEEPRVRLLYYDHFDVEPRACAAKGGSWGDDTIRMRVSTDCLDGHARRRAFLDLSTALGEQFDEVAKVRLRKG